MNTANLSETEKIRLERIKSIFANADRLDLEKYLDSFTENARFQVGSEPPAVGREAIKEAGSKIFSAVKAMKHDIIEIWLEDNAAIVEATVYYTRRDDLTVAVPCVTILRTDNDLIKDARVYMDISPVFKTRLEHD